MVSTLGIKWAEHRLRLLIAAPALITALSGHLALAESPSPVGAKTALGTEAEPAKIDVGSSPSIGPANARVTLIVFSDFECPFCARGAGILQEVIRRYGGQVRVAFKHNPLPFHAHARLAAAAAEASNLQGRFWEMHTLLFSRQNALDPASLEHYAQQLGLDLTAFRDSIASGQADVAVAADVQQAKDLGIQGTPTFFVNGRVIRGAQPIDVFIKAIDAELSQTPAQSGIRSP